MKEVLLNLYKYGKNAKEIIRSHAVLLVKSGKTKTEVARWFYVDEEIIHDWVDEWNSNRKLEDMVSGVVSFIKSIPKEVVKSVCSYQYLLVTNP